LTANVLKLLHLRYLANKISFCIADAQVLSDFAKM